MPHSSLVSATSMCRALFKALGKAANEAKSLPSRNFHSSGGQRPTISIHIKGWGWWRKIKQGGKSTMGWGSRGVAVLCRCQERASLRGKLLSDRDESGTVDQMDIQRKTFQTRRTASAKALRRKCIWHVQ